MNDYLKQIQTRESFLRGPHPFSNQKHTFFIDKRGKKLIKKKDQHIKPLNVISGVCLLKKTGWDNTMKGLRHLNVPTCHEILLGVLFILFFVDQTKTQLIGKYFKYLYLISRAINLIPISWYLCLEWEN